MHMLSHKYLSREFDLFPLGFFSYIHHDYSSIFHNMSFFPKIFLFVVIIMIKGSDTMANIFVLLIVQQHIMLYVIVECVEFIDLVVNLFIFTIYETLHAE